MRPYGFAPDRVTVDDREAAIVRKAAQQLLDGSSLRAIVAWLNDTGERTTSGGPWQPITLRRVLLSPRTAGQVEDPDGTTRRAPWQALLDELTARRVRELLQDPDRRPNDTTTRSYLLTGGLVVCGSPWDETRNPRPPRAHDLDGTALCGAPLVSRPTEAGRRGYVCRTGPSTYGCGRIRVQADPLEEHVAALVLGRLAQPATRRAVRDYLSTSEQQTTRRTADLEDKLRQLGTDYADDLIGRAEFHAARRRVQEHLDAVRKLAERADRARGLPLDLTPEQLAAWWDAATLDTRRDLVTVLVDRLVVRPAVSKGSRAYDPQRLRVEWAT